MFYVKERHKINGKEKNEQKCPKNKREKQRTKIVIK